MAEPSLNCPVCGESIKLTESLAGPLIESTRREFEAKIKAKDTDLANKVAALDAEKATLEDSKKALAGEIQKGIESERAVIAKIEAEKAKRLLAIEFQAKESETEELKTVLADRDKKLGEAQAKQAAIMKQQRELEDAQREMEVTIQTRVNAEADLVRQKAKLDAETSMSLRVKEKEMTISAMQKQIEDLKRRAEQGSQQIQGEVLEVELETTLKLKFVYDNIVPVAKGVQGGDLIQTVMSPTGVFCGKILWETKRTKAWSGSWIAKLKEDQRRAQANIAIIMTSALPAEIKRFGQINGVWVTDFQSAFSLIDALRMTLIQVANTKALQDGQETKMELVYEYLTGPKFKHRVEAIVEKFEDMRADLNREKKVTMKNWAKRDTQIEGVIMATMGMYGDLEGIAGQAMPQIDGLDAHPLLEGDTDEGFNSETNSQ